MKVTPGKYRHFKGNEYEVLGTAVHSETEEELVVYRRSDGSLVHGEYELCVRPLSMFVETIERDGKEMPRFKRIM